MAKQSANKTDKKPFVSTFKKYKEMNEGEQAAFRQGAKTTENKVKENLGFIKKN